MPDLKPLGRIVQHDPRSLNFAAPAAPTLKSVTHRRLCPPFDQGQLGSCTGNAMAGLLMTTPTHPRGVKLTEVDAVKLYSYATTVDDAPGSYPPDDTGSSGLAVAKAAQHYGYITAYAHAFGLDHVLAALVLAPVIIGVNWYEGFDNPDANGWVHISGSVRGGHEFELVGLNVHTKSVTAVNSWGSEWGAGGRFRFSWDVLGQLLAEQGDATTVTL